MVQTKWNHLLLLVSYLGTASLSPIKIAAMQINPQNLINESIFDHWCRLLFFLFQMRITKPILIHCCQTVAVLFGRSCFSWWWTITDWYGLPFVGLVLYTKCLSQTTEFEQKENCVLLQQVFFSSLFIVVAVVDVAFLFLRKTHAVIIFFLWRTILS